MKIFIDIPKYSGLWRLAYDACLSVGHTISDSPIDASYVIKAIGLPAKHNVDPERSIILGDFRYPQTIPSKALPIDYNTGMVQLPGGQTMSWKHYTFEWMVDCPLDKSL